MLSFSQERSSSAASPHDRISAQPIVVVQVLVAERQAEDALADQRLECVLDQLGRTGVAEAGRKAFGEPDRLVGGAEQQRTAIRGDRAAIKGAYNPTAFDGSEIERPTLCRHRGALLLRPKSFSQKHFLLSWRPDTPTQRETAGLVLDYAYSPTTTATLASLIAMASNAIWLGFFVFMIGVIAPFT